jgi:hypothetical protein
MGSRVMCCWQTLRRQLPMQEFTNQKPAQEASKTILHAMLADIDRLGAGEVEQGSGLGIMGTNPVQTNSLLSKESITAALKKLQSNYVQ